MTAPLKIANVERRGSGQKTASGDFFRNPNKRTYRLSPEALKTCRENWPVNTATASGIPLWPSRDPIAEAGGWNLYGFVANNSTGNWDYLGQWDKVKREKKMFATVCAQKGDTWDDLASTLGLSASEASKWVSNYDSLPKPGKTYQVPNRIFLVKGQADPWYNLKEILILRVENSKIQRDYEEEGFNVTAVSKFSSVARTFHLHGVVYNGHGGRLYQTRPDGSKWYTNSYITPLLGPERFTANDWTPPHLLSHVHIIACHSSLGHWGDWASPNGEVLTYEGTIVGLPDTPDFDRPGGDRPEPQPANPGNDK